MAEYARTFEEFIAWLSLNSPAATIMDSWRRVDRELDEVAKEKGITRKPPARFESALAQDPHLGTAFVSRVNALRRRRNAVTHEPASLSPEEARAYAYEAFDVIGVLGSRPPAEPRAGAP